MRRKASKLRSSTSPSESEIQRAVIEWRDLVVHQYPDLALLHAIPNGGMRSKRTAAILRLEGVLAGVSDLFLPVARGGFNGLYIEMKTPRGRLSEAQRWFLDSAIAGGYAGFVMRSMDDTARLLVDYISGKDLSESQRENRRLENF